MKVQKIVRKDSRNVSITFDNGEVLFLAVDIFIKSGIRKNDEITDNRFLSLINENKIFHIRQRAFRFLGRRLHSVSELRTKLLQKGYDKLLVEGVLNELKEKDYLNDNEFAKMFIDEKIKTKLWGERKLRNELIKKGVNAEIITETIKNSIPAEDNFTNAMEIATKKYKVLTKKSLDNNVIKRKLISFLNSRGYDYDVIKEVCNKLIRETNGSD
jgi:regulatory protein